MIIGQAAGVAASLAIRKQTPVQEISVAALQQNCTIITQCCILMKSFTQWWLLALRVNRDSTLPGRTPVGYGAVAIVSGNCIVWAGAPGLPGGSSVVVPLVNVLVPTSEIM
jgi:hypothetical protein